MTEAYGIYLAVGVALIAVYTFCYFVSVWDEKRRKRDDT